MHSLQQLMADVSLAEALARVESQIKARPADADLRAAFVQLLCLVGNWARAQTQLQSWLALKPQAQPTVTLLSQAISGELQRAGVFNGEGEPRLPGSAFSWAADLLHALRADLSGETHTADALRQAAFDAAAVNPGQATLQDTDSVRPFAWLIDGDGRLGPVCELIVQGCYYWLPFSVISEMRFQAPASASDLVWRHTWVRLIDGTEQVCQVPVRYPLGSDADDRFRRASFTEWQPLDTAGQQFIGQGQKVWLNDETEFPVLDLETLAFNASKAGDE